MLGVLFGRWARFAATESVLAANAADRPESRAMLMKEGILDR